MYFPPALDKGHAKLPGAVRNSAHHQHLVLDPDAGTGNWSIQGSPPQLQLSPKAPPEERDPEWVLTHCSGFST